jgi:TolB-like protein
MSLPDAGCAGTIGSKEGLRLIPVGSNILNGISACQLRWNCDGLERRHGRAAAHAVPLLNSWKEIAAYLRTSVRTVQRWERAEGLPVHRHQHATCDTVYAYTPEIEAWLGTRGGNCRRQGGCGESLPAVTRMIVLPFRLIQHDRDIEYLCFALADAITTSLSGLDSLSVRSSMVAAKYATEDDLQRIAKEVPVDFAVIGTLLRSGDQLRVNVQLVNASSGTAVWSRTVQGGIADVFQLLDRVTAQIVDALALPANVEKWRLLDRDIPGSPRACEYYLRANELAHDFDPTACDLYSRCARENPAYAPAWACLGRCCRILANFGGHPDCFHQAEAAFARALERVKKHWGPASAQFR